MTQKQSTSQSLNARNKLIAWTVIICLLLAGGALAARYWFGKPADKTEIDIGQVDERPVPAHVDGVHASGMNFYRIDAGDFFMTLTPKETSFAPLRLYVDRHDLPQDERLLLQFCRDTQNTSYAKTLGVTPEQADRLKAIRENVGEGMTLDDGDRNKLRTSWKNWVDAKDKAAKSAAEQPLLDAMQEIGNRQLDSTRKHYADLAGQIRAVVTGDQLAQFRQHRQRGL